MSRRRRNLVLVQLILFLLGAFIIFYTYYGGEETDRQIISSENQKMIKDTLVKQDNTTEDVFYNIKYSGVDLAGNRYVLSSKEAINNKDDSELVNMKFVEVNFYFKDDTILNVVSNKGTYNNKTLDMKFEDNVKAIYEGSELFAEKAFYSNLNSFLTISENVTVKDQRGTLVADKLLFDIKKQNLNIISFNNNKINANIDLK